MFKPKGFLAASAVITLLATLGAVNANAADRVTVLRTVVVTPGHFAHRHRPPGVTAGEAARIRHQVHEHRQMQRIAGADGRITRREQAWLARDAAQLRHLIHQAKTH